MKKYTLPLASVALALALACITQVGNSKNLLSGYYWFEPGYTIQPKSEVDVTSTIPQEKSRTGCTGTSGTSCKDGYPATQVVDDGNGNYMASGTKTVIYQSF